MRAAFATRFHYEQPHVCCRLLQGRPLLDPMTVVHQQRVLAQALRRLEGAAEAEEEDEEDEEDEDEDEQDEDEEGATDEAAAAPRAAAARAQREEAAALEREAARAATLVLGASHPYVTDLAVARRGVGEEVCEVGEPEPKCARR